MLDGEALCKQLKQKKIIHQSLFFNLKFSIAIPNQRVSGSNIQYLFNPSQGQVGNTND